VNTDIQKSVSWYEHEREKYDNLAEEVKNIIMRVLESQKIDYYIIQARAKSIDSFKSKLEKKSIMSTDVKDLAGIRIIGYVLTDVEKICGIIRNLFEVTQQGFEDKSEILGIDRVGYRSQHFNALFTKERTALSDYRRFEGMSFEIQVRTVLQHAWAEIEHDRNYKFSGILPKEIQRKFHLLAGTLELIDNEFERIAQGIDKYSQEVSNRTRIGELDISINSTSLKQYLTEKFADIPKMNMDITPEDSIIMIEELKSMGVDTLSGLDQIIPQNFREALTKLVEEKPIRPLGLLRIILIAHDISGYFRKAWKGHFGSWGASAREDSIYKKYLNLDSKKIDEYINKKVS
jgi:putative GTP pyrophosphokinase